MIAKQNNHWYVSLFAFLACVLVGISDDLTPSSNLSEGEQRVKSSAMPAPAAPREKTVPVMQQPIRNEVAPTPAADAVQFEVKDLRIQGDLQFFDAQAPVDRKGTSLRQELYYECIGKSLSMNDVRVICSRYTQIMIDRGYYLAYIMPISYDPAAGTVVLETKTATFGEPRLFQKSATDESGAPIPYTGKYYTESQIRTMLRIPKAEPFNYNDLHRSIFSLNSHPDINLDTTLHVVGGGAPGARQQVDMDYLVTEKSPWHGSLQVDNTATEETNDWRTRLTIQHLNFTRHFDIFTADIATAFDGSFSSGSVSYSYPCPAVPRASLTVFAGASNLNIDRVVPGVDADGEGWFSGLQLRKPLCTTNTHNLDLILDLTHRNTEHQWIDANNNNAVYERDIAVTPFTVGLSYASTADDRFKGRNFANINLSMNYKNWLGSDDDVNSAGASQVADDIEYYVSRLQIARLQRIPVQDGNWLMFVRADGQWANNPLIPSEQKAVGGMNSVRGYHEREMLGDDGVTASIELRTPLAIDGLSFKFNEQNKQTEQTLQGVIFSDYGYIRRDARLQQGKQSEDMLSVGVGVRVSVFEHFQLRFDWGFPLAGTAETDTHSNGRGHFVAQVQF